MERARIRGGIEVALLIAVVTPLLAAAVVFAAAKGSVFAALAVGVLLSSPYARLVTLPLRPREPRRPLTWSRARSGLLLDAALFGGAATFVGAALIGRSLGGQWGIVVGVGIAGGLLWALRWIYCLY